MKLSNYHIDKERYAKCIEVSKRVRWDIDNDIIRGREFDFSQKFLPDGISKVDELDLLNNDEKRLLNQSPGPNLRQHVWICRTVYYRQGS